MTTSARAVLFDVDGTLIDDIDNLRAVWRSWSVHYGLDPDVVVRIGMERTPLDAFAELVPHLDPNECFSVHRSIEDRDAESARCVAHDGAELILASLPSRSWGVVTSNYANRVLARFERAGLPRPEVLVDAATVSVGKPSPEGYLLAARLIGAKPENCLVIEDGTAGISAGQSAGMTVWAVNRDDPAGADCFFRSLADAASSIVGWQESGSA